MTRRPVVVVLLVAALALAACGVEGDGPLTSQLAAQDQALSLSSSLQGRVTDAATGHGLSGVLLSSSGRHTRSEDDGTYQLSVPAGTQTLTASHRGYRTATQVVKPRRDHRLHVDLELTPEGSGAHDCTYTYGPWGACGPGGTQVRTVIDSRPEGCAGTPVLSQACQTGSACTYTYSAWGVCQADGTQSRTVVSSTPAGCSGTPALSQACGSTPPPTGAGFKVLGANDLGMHCVDRSYSVFSILPPFNIVATQVVALQSTGRPVLLDQTQVDVRFSAVPDALGSVNSTSLGKSDFWQYALPLYGLTLAPGEGLLGMWMPADAPTLAGRTMQWDTVRGLFLAPGIPIFPTDDQGRPAFYPLLRFGAYDKAGALLGATDIVLPVSDETSCQNCHATGQVAAPTGVLTWSTDPDLESQARRNVLTLHNARIGTNLQPPVLCASCHYSTALDLAGVGGPSGTQVGKPTSSAVMHAFHAGKMGALNDAPVPVGGAVPAATAQSCYQCHPGAVTQCLRGAMTSKVTCQNCHGAMSAVGGQSPLLAGGSLDGTNDGQPRRPWIDLPRCESCHAGDAMVKTVVASPPPLAPDGIRFNEAFRAGDPSASPILASNTRFAAEPGKLFRRSKGHGGLQCEACHGSTHAIWAANANDNVEAISLQGHAGTISECSTCHLSPPTNGLGGPHGMHPVGAAWVSAHQGQAGSQLASCRACHGADDRGTVLSRMFMTRTVGGRTLAAGTSVGCYTCHNGPSGG
jgi:hypothetical protein